MPHSSSSVSSSGFHNAELLAPAGTLLSLIAGIQNGADAVYMGAARFGARAFAGNFSDRELTAGIDYAHAFGKKVYVTLNTLYREDELDDVMDLFSQLYEHGADSFIVQDLGLLNRLFEKYPNFQIHASTQMTIHNSYHAAFLKKYGVSRIVPARENSIEELLAIKDTGVEVETFVHGALCISYSGQCLFSGLVGSRSGNRGKCAQPCRKKYELLADGKTIRTDGQYLLSPRDLNAADNISKLMKVGIDAFKIEGRMKKPEYVAGVVSVYRKIIDRIFSSQKESLPTHAEKEKLKKIFNRDFTEGYFFSNPKNELMSRKLPYNKGLIIGKISAVNDRNAQINISLTSDLSARDGISIGDVGKNTGSDRDPRQGFMIKKMFINHKICDKAGAGDIVSIPAAFLFDHDDVPNVGDFVYKTYDDRLQRELSETLPSFEDGQLEEIVFEAYQSKSKTSISFDVEKQYLSTDQFPLSELIEKISPEKSLKINVSFSCKIQAGSPIIIAAQDFDGNTISMQSEYIIEPAQKNPVTKEQATDLLSKVGSTIYNIFSVYVSIEGDCFIPVGEFKNIRNKALQALLTVRIEKKRRTDPQKKKECTGSQKEEGCADSQNEVEYADSQKEEECTDSQNEVEYAGSQKEERCDLKLPVSILPFLQNPQVSVCVYSADDLKAALNAGADRVYISHDIFKCPVTKEEFGIPLRQLKSVLADASAQDLDKIFFRTTFVTKESYFKDLEETLLVLLELGVKNISASNLGVYEYLLSNPRFSESFKIAADAAFNIFNSDAASIFTEAGAASVLLSPEISINDIASLSRGYIFKTNSLPAFEAAVHGRQRLMVTEHPLLDAVLDKNSFKNKSFSNNGSSVPLERYVLKDSKNFSFPVLSDTTGRCFIFNSKELNAYDLLPNLKAAGVSIFRIDGIGHTPDEIFELVCLYKKGLAESETNEFYESHSKDGSEFTKGTFIRGVE